MGKRIFWALFIFILLAGVALRFYDLTERPIHHDEGVIGWFKERILKACLNPSYGGLSLEGLRNYAQTCGASYTYDPDYHGPFEYLIGAWAFKLFGTSDFMLRAPEAFFNFATILLLIPLRKKLGDAGTLTAGALIALSPSMVYYAQRAYMDNFFLFFTVGAVVCAAKFWEERKSIWLYLGAIDLALLVSTKETAYIFMFIGASFAILEYAFQSVFKKGSFREEMDRRFMSPGKFASLLLETFGSLRGERRKEAETQWGRLVLGTAKIARQALPGLIVFFVVFAFVYSTMFMDFIDVGRGIANGLTFWLNRSTTWEGHFKPFIYYTQMLWDYEKPVLLLSLLFLPFAFRNSFTRWCVWWAFSAWLIFSLIPYKTPWLDVHFILPMAFAAGAGVDSFVSKMRENARAIPLLIILPLLALSAYTAYDVTYLRHSDDRVTLVYVSSLPEYKLLVARVEELSVQYNGFDTEISSVSNEYWPLPWSLRDYGRATWHGRSVPGQSVSIIISSRSDFHEIQEELRDEYSGPEAYKMRPGVSAYLYHRTIPE